MGQEIRDESGKLVGVFYTADEYRKIETERALLESFREEAKEQEKGVAPSYDLSKAMTTTQVLALMERLGREAHEGK